MMKSQMPNQWEVLFWWFVHSHQLYANLLCCCSFVLPASTLAFYLFKCKHFKADCIPSDKFPVNQDCLHFHVPSPHFKKTCKKMFHCETEEKETFSDPKEMFSYVQENKLFICCYLYIEIAHSCWTET
uniref:Uncharacterized protein n=1 Tax=Pipistrellus kuhlii TaxID=59472 RepID=A0A7J7X035_PIPKU|nr:hypothetical protein mPipKuh1_010774 [Pipistrellus kuhlii]